MPAATELTIPEKYLDPYPGYQGTVLPLSAANAKEDYKSKHKYQGNNQSPNIMRKSINTHVHKKKTKKTFVGFMTTYLGKRMLILILARIVLLLVLVLITHNEDNSKILFLISK